MISIVTGILFGLGFITTFFLFSNGQSFTNDKNIIRVSLVQTLKLDNYQDKAAAVGWQVSKKELILFVCISIIISLLASMLTNNPMVLIVGVIAGIYFPNFIINKKRKARKMALVSKLTNPLRMLLSRIPDQQNITRAIEVIKNETTDEHIKQLFINYLSEVAISGSVRDALLGMKQGVRLRKFDVFIEHLLQAQYEGFTSNAMKALDKTVEAIEFNLRAIEKVKEQSKFKKKQLYTTLGTAWLFPLILSFVNTGDTNVYLNTVAGKILILMYFLGTLYIIEKGEEYLSLKLDEL